MESIVTICMSIIGVLIIVLIYFLFRNNKVFIFRVTVLRFSYKALENYILSMPEEDFIRQQDEYNRLNDLVEHINESSYTKMLFSIKPLKLKYWFNEEEIEFIRKGMGKSNIKL